MLTWRGVSKLCSAAPVDASTSRSVWRQKELLVIARDRAATLGVASPTATTKMDLCAFLAKLGEIRGPRSGVTGASGVTRLARKDGETSATPVVTRKSAPPTGSRRRASRDEKTRIVEREEAKSTLGATETRKKRKEPPSSSSTTRMVPMKTVAPAAAAAAIKVELRNVDGREKARGTVSGSEDECEIVASLVQFIVRPRDHAVARDIVVRLGRDADAEPEHVRTDVHQLRPGSLYVFSRWRSVSAMDAHLAAFLSPKSLARTRLAHYLVAPPTVSRAKMLSRPDSSPPTGVPPQVTLVPFFSVAPDPECVRRVADAHLSVIDSTRREPGCLAYELYQLIGTPQLMFFYELWASAEALATHMNTPTFYRVVRNQVDPLLLVPWTALNMEYVRH